MHNSILLVIIKVLYSTITMPRVKKLLIAKKTVVPESKRLPDQLFQTIQRSIPVACIDLVMLRKNKGVIETLLIKRKLYPEEGKWCLIGGRILKGERARDTIRRQAFKELGVSVKILPPWNEMMPLGVFSDPVSDKQKHFVVLVYPVIITKGKLKKDGPEFSEIKWFKINKLPKIIGFDQKKWLKAFVKTNLQHSIE